MSGPHPANHRNPREGLERRRLTLAPDNDNPSIWIHMGNGVMFEAAGSGNLELVQWLRANGCDWCDHACGEAAEGGHLEVLQWLRANGCPWHRDTCYFAVDKGHVEVLRWARENGCPWTAVDRDQAAEKLGYTDNLGNVVDWLSNPI